MERLQVSFPSGPGGYGIQVTAPDGDVVFREEPAHETLFLASEEWGRILFSICHGDTSESGLDRRLIDLCRRGMVEVIGVA